MAMAGWAWGLSKLVSWDPHFPPHLDDVSAYVRLDWRVFGTPVGLVIHRAVAAQIDARLFDVSVCHDLAATHGAGA